jgi:D-alanyl-D-alanine carboxypeptidase
MKKGFIIFHAVPAALFVGIVFSLIFTNGIANAQSRVSRIVKVTPVGGGASSDKIALNAKFATAAGENSRSVSALNWTFGGKVQTGWEIYEPLVADTIAATGTAGTPEFASALSKWQLTHSLTPTGIVDETTLGSFMSYWQSRRLGRSDFPGPDKLISAPISDFYDPTRDADLLQLESQTYTAYKRMIAAAARDLSHDIHFTKNGELAPGEKYLRIVSAFRSQEYQDKLRAKSPGSGRTALALHSAHNTGQALDLYVGGDPVSTKDANRLLQTQTPVYKWLVKNARRFGFYNYFYEPWHWEYVPDRKN